MRDTTVQTNYRGRVCMDYCDQNLQSKSQKRGKKEYRLANESGFLQAQVRRENGTQS